MIDPVEFGKAIGGIVREIIEPLKQMVEQLKQQLSAMPSADELAQKAAALVPPAKAGYPGVSVTVDDVMPALKAYVDDYLKSLPVPKNGEPGASVTVDDVLPALKVHADDFLKSLPVPKNGEPGKDAIPPTADDIAATFERRFSDLQLSWERQVREATEKALEKIPVPKDGRDALEVEHFDLALADDGRTITVSLKRGETVIAKSIKLPSVVDRGVYSDAKAADYETGDGVTYGGCYWIAQKSQPEGAPGSSPDWRLAVKKGRDGKDLRENASRHDSSKGVSVRGQGYQPCGNDLGSPPGDE